MIIHKFPRNTPMKRNILLIICLLSLTVLAKANPVAWEANCGQTYTLTAVPNEGYEFEAWSDGNTNPNRDTIFTDQPLDVIYAIFKHSGSGTSITNANAENIALYPTMVALGGQVTVSGLAANEQTTIRVFSTTGHLVSTFTTIGEAKYTMDAAGVSGCYFVHISSRGVEAVRRFVVYAK